MQIESQSECFQPIGVLFNADRIKCAEGTRSQDFKHTEERDEKQQPIIFP